MNLDPNQSFRHSRAGKHAAAVRDGRHEAANAPTVTLKTPAQKIYLGDGVYAVKEFGQVVLTTEDGVSTTNRIVLEPEVYHALIRYVAGASIEKRG